MSDVSVIRPVAYFCAEYGLEGLPLYAGGLGVLAGDTVKEAADQNFPMIAIGLLYRGGKAVQKLSAEGRQYEEDLLVDPLSLGFEHVFVPNEDQPLFVRVHLTSEDVWARVWKRTVNNMTLYLLDTDTDQNAMKERSICKAIYFGSEEAMIKQQMVLGIGGVKLLDALNIHPSVYHLNEGRPAFLYWQVIRQMMENTGITFAEAKVKAKNMIVYTNHTLVRAGNQIHDLELIKKYSLYYANKMGVTLEELLSPGIDQASGGFSITQFALNVSRKASAVSQPHYQLSKQLWPEYDWVGITNGVHRPTWQDIEIRDSQEDLKALWEIHRKKKRELMEWVVTASGFGYDPDRLVIAWARRIAGYKRLNAIFEDVQKLAGLLKNQDRPIQLIIAGKAHAADEEAKEMLKGLIKIMGEDLAGHAIFVPNYNIETAKMMVKGSDVWMNTPIQGQEASGTSGMKAIANGVLQLTVEDGWAAEVDWQGMGWTLDNEHLAETLYFRLEQDIAPLFYKRDSQGLPIEWLERMQKTIRLSDHYATDRMLKEYKELLYD